MHYKLVENGDKAFLHLFTEQNEARLFLTYEKKGSSFKLVYSFLNADKILFRSAAADDCSLQSNVFARLRDVSRSLKIDLSSAQCSDKEEQIIRSMLEAKNEILPLKSSDFKSCLSLFTTNPAFDEGVSRWTSAESFGVDFRCPSISQNGLFVRRPPTVGVSREILGRAQPLEVQETLREELLHWLGFEDDLVINECIIPNCISQINTDRVSGCLKRVGASPVDSESDPNSEKQEAAPSVVVNNTRGSAEARSQNVQGINAQVPNSIQIAAVQASSPSASSSRPLQGQSLLTAAVGAFRGQIAFADAGGASARIAGGSAVQGSGSRGPASVGRRTGGRAPLRNVTEPRSRSQQNFQATIPSVDDTKFDSGSSARGPASVDGSSSNNRQKREVSSAASSSSRSRAGGRSGSRLVSGSAGGAGGSSGSAFDRLPQGLAASLPPTAEQLIRRLESTVQSLSLDRVEEQLNTLSDDLNEAGITVYTPGDGRRFGAPRGQVWFRIDSEGRLVDVTPRR